MYAYQRVTIGRILYLYIKWHFQLVRLGIMIFYLESDSSEDNFIAS